MVWRCIYIRKRKEENKRKIICIEYIKLGANVALILWGRNSVADPFESISLGISSW
jgi:hypothetical protein